MTNELDKIIEASRTMLEPELDENEVHIQEETWMRAVKCLRNIVKSVGYEFNRILDLPEILPGPDGSVDLHWEYPTYEMLINIPADPDSKAGFYGDDRGGKGQTKGSFDPAICNDDNHGLLLWLAMRCSQVVSVPSTYNTADKNTVK